MQLEKANIQAIPISNVGIAIAAGNGAKDPRPEWFNPYPGAMDAAKQEQYSDTFIRVFRSLLAEKKVPTWTFQLLDIDAINSRKK